MLNNVMPQRGVFFSLLTSHTDRMVAAANATLRLISGLGNRAGQRRADRRGQPQRDQRRRIKAEFIQLLYESFTTPINRDQLHTLILDLDRVLDTLQSVANAVNIYHISRFDARGARQWRRWPPMPACA